MLFAVLTPLFLVAAFVLLRNATRVLASGSARGKGGRAVTRAATPGAFWREVATSGGLGLALLAAGLHAAWRAWAALLG